MDKSNIKTADPAHPGLLPSVTVSIFFLHSPGYKAEISCWLAHSSRDYKIGVGIVAVELLLEPLEN